MSNTHIARAKDYIAKGEDYYRKAADEIVSARKADPAITFRQIANEVGKSAGWVSALVQWRTNVQDPEHGPFGGAEENQARYERQARTALTDPVRRRQAIAELPSEQIEEVIQEANDVAIERLRAKRAEHDTAPKAPTADQLMGAERFDPSESWADADIIRVREKAHTLRRQVEKWGLVLGSMGEEQAFEYLQEAERNIAEVRVALQERMADRSRTEV